MSYGFQDIFL